MIVDSLFTLQFSERDKKRQKTLTGSQSPYQAAYTEYQHKSSIIFFQTNPEPFVIGSATLAHLHGVVS